MAFTVLGTGKQLPQFTSGTARGSWTTELNEELIQPVNNYLGLTRVVRVLNANTVTLSEEQREVHGLKFTDGSSGALDNVDDVSVIFAPEQGSFIIDNCLPCGVRIIKAGNDGNPTVIQPGITTQIYYDGTQWKSLINPLDGSVVDGNAKLYDTSDNAIFRVYDDGTIAGRSNGSTQLQYKSNLTFREEITTDANFNATDTQNRLVIASGGNVFIGKDGPGLGVPGVEFHPNTVAEGNAQGTHMAVIGTRSSDIVRIFGENKSTATGFRESFFDHNSGSIEIRKGLPVDRTEPAGTGGQRAIDFYLDGIFCGAIVMEIQVDRATNNPVGSLQILDGRGRRIYMRQDNTQG